MIAEMYTGGKRGAVMKEAGIPVQCIKGIGPKKAKLLAGLGIKDTLDLLYHYPRRYEDRSRLKTLGSLQPGENETALAMIERVEELRPRTGLRIIKVFLHDETGTVSAVWFNQPYLKKQLLPGKKMIITGKVTQRYGQKEIVVSEYEIISKDSSLHTGRIVPVYPSTDGLSQRFWREVQFRITNNHLGSLQEIFNETELRKYSLMSVKSAFSNIHFPSGLKELNEARYRIVFEELFLLQMTLAVIHDKTNMRTGIIHSANHPQENEFYQNLSFGLTKAQKRVIEEIRLDMEEEKSMSRLLQGDVGSGKTVIAAWALLKTCANGHMGVLMVPTEILAQQQYESITRWLEPLGIKTALLTGSTANRNKEQILKQIISRDVDIIIGTHALIQERVVLDGAGLVIIDEQHRFGVRQRGILENKGNNPDVLVMTATPIPRTLAMSVYGDLDISTLDELPPGRKEVITYCIKEEARAKLYGFIKGQLNTGAQIFVVCPLVEESKMPDIANAIKTAAEMKEKLSPVEVGLIHGQMPAKEKDRIMDRFRCEEIKVLVSTTVIEVGIDVPGASVIVIENAERFGLAQLHQLRGRVGRGCRQSYCILVTPSKKAPALKRLKLFTTTHDGFMLAEEDLKLRGPGEFFGMRQHGLPELKLADLITDSEALNEARQLVREILKDDPHLIKEKHKNMSFKIMGMIGKMIR